MQGNRTMHSRPFSDKVETKWLGWPQTIKKKKKRNTVCSIHGGLETLADVHCDNISEHELLASSEIRYLARLQSALNKDRDKSNYVQQRTGKCEGTIAYPIKTSCNVTSKCLYRRAWLLANVCKMSLVTRWPFMEYPFLYDQPSYTTKKKKKKIQDCIVFSITEHPSAFRKLSQPKHWEMYSEARSTEENILRL